MYYYCYNCEKETKHERAYRSEADCPSYYLMLEDPSYEYDVDKEMKTIICMECGEDRTDEGF